MLRKVIPAKADDPAKARILLKRNGLSERDAEVLLASGDDLDRSVHSRLEGDPPS
jgi:hypothetical protein